MGKVYITWKAVENFVDLVDKTVREKYPNVTGVYGIPRGGLILAVMLSHKLSVPLLMSPTEGCLIVDDICDSGESLLHYVKNSSSPDKPKYITATIAYKDNRLGIKPDIYSRVKGEDWICFPWEISLKQLLKQYPQDEIWLDIPQYEDRYIISTHSRIKGKVSQKVLSYDDNNVCLYAYKGDMGTRYKKCDLLAGTFLGLDFTNPYHNKVLFRDGDATNLTLSNLYIEDLSDLDNEEWHLIDTWKGHALNPWYYISSLGRVKVIARDIVANVKGNKMLKRYPGHILTATPDTDGYLNVELPDIEGNYHTAYIHRLVATFFLPKDVNDTEVNHIDGVKTNNKVSNLEWCTHQENMQHAIDSGFMSWQK